MPKDYQVNVGLANGLDQSTKPFGVKQGKWWDSMNFRHFGGAITQIPRRVVHAKCSFGSNQRVTAIRVLPLKHMNRSAVLFFCGGKVFRMLYDASSVRAIVGTTNSFNSGGPLGRWTATIHGDRCYFTNLQSQVAYTDGCTVSKFSTEAPCSRYLTMFFDHLIAGNVVYKGASMPSRFMWSDLNKIGDWNPLRTNEADWYDCMESASETDAVGGVTGQARMNNSFITYTPSVIYETAYVGLPRVFLTAPRFSGLGCDLQYGLVSQESLHFFPCLKLKLFFQYSADGPKPISADLGTFFSDDISTDPQEQQMTWGYSDESNNEVVWVYMSKANPGMIYDRALHYNYIDKVWFRSSVENLSAFGGGFGYVNKSVDDLTGTQINNLSVSCDVLDITNRNLVPRMYGGFGGNIYMDQIVSIPDKFETYVQPYLETGDKTYNAPQEVKEIESMIIDASAPSGLLVDLASRDLFQDAVNYVQQTQTWFSTLKEKRLSFPHKSGKILRLRFRPVVVNYAPTIKHLSAHVEIGTKKYTLFSKLYNSASPPSGAIYFTRTGVASVILIGAGGGGGCANPLGNWHSYAFVQDATHKTFLGVTKQESYGKEYSALLLEQDLYDISTDGTVFGPVYFPIAGIPDPNLVLNQQQKDYLYTTAVASFRAQFPPTNVILNVYFVQKATAGARGFLWSTYAAGDKTPTALIDMPVVAWYIAIDYGAYDYGAQYGYDARLQFAGGGGGAYIRGNLTVSSTLQTQYYIRGKCGNHTIAGAGFAVKGADGGFTQLKLGAEQIKAGGGTGGGDSGGGYVSGTGGAVTLSSLSLFSTVTSVVGEDAVAQSPATGVPAVIAKSGRGYSLDKVLQSLAKPSSKGLGYGGGGCGRFRDYTVNLNRAQGAEGIFWLGYRVGPDNLMYPYPGLSALNNIEKTADKQTSSQTIALGGTSANVTISFYIKAVVEMKTYTGGTVVGTSVRKNAAPAVDNRSVLKLVIGVDTYYLNHKLVPDNACQALNYNIIITIPGDSTLVLTLDNIDSKQYEPRDLNGLAIDTAEQCDLHEPQWATIEVFDLVSIVPPVMETPVEFIAYHEQVIANKAEK